MHFSDQHFSIWMHGYLSPEKLLCLIFGQVAGRESSSFVPALAISHITSL